MTNHYYTPSKFKMSNFWFHPKIDKILGKYKMNHVSLGSDYKLVLCLFYVLFASSTLFCISTFFFFFFFVSYYKYKLSEIWDS